MDLRRKVHTSINKSTLYRYRVIREWAFHILYFFPKPFSLPLPCLVCVVSEGCTRKKIIVGSSGALNLWNLRWQAFNCYEVQIWFPCHKVPHSTALLEHSPIIQLSSKGLWRWGEYLNIAQPTEEFYAQCRDSCLPSPLILQFNWKSLAKILHGTIYLAGPFFFNYWLFWSFCFLWPLLGDKAITEVSTWYRIPVYGKNSLGLTDALVFSIKSPVNNTVFIEPTLTKVS